MIDSPRNRHEPRHRGTTTSEFGISRRESHDASAFYDRFSPPQLSDDSEVVDCTVKDTIFGPPGMNVGRSRDRLLARAHGAGRARSDRV